MGIRFPCLEDQCNLPPQFVPQTYCMHIISCLRKMGEERDKGLGLFLPPRDQAQTTRLMLNEPLHVQLAALFLRPFGNDGLDIAILTRLHARAIVTKGVDDAGMQAGVATHEQDPALAIHVAERGQIEGPTVRQEQGVLQTCRGRPIRVFGGLCRGSKRW